MKCLENLSLVDDSCIEDLKRDIEKLINSYIDVYDKCIEVFERLEKDMTTTEFIRLCHAFPDDNFYLFPQWMDGTDNITKLENFFDKQEDFETISWVRFMANNSKKNIDLYDGQFWLWGDGANWEFWIDTHKKMIEMIKYQMSHEENITLIDVYKTLVQIENSRS